jgi:hypothetical protein
MRPAGSVAALSIRDPSLWANTQIAMSVKDAVSLIGVSAVFLDVVFG